MAAALIYAAPGALASYHSFQIEQLYSNADGTVQFIVLHESAGFSGEEFLTGHTLTSTHAGVTKTFTFPNDLPSDSTAGRRVLIATQAFATLGLATNAGYGEPPPSPPPPPAMGPVTPDYVIPNGFLPTDGGTINYADVDILTYASLPTDGTNALLRSGSISPNVATNFAGSSAMVPAFPVTVVEFYNANLDHFFISASQPDIDALDTGRIAGWARTGQAFKVFPSQAAGGAGVNSVCRFYIPPQHGNSHFFSASPAECSTILAKIPTDPNYSGYVYESPNVFYTALPDTTTGACPSNTQAVYRLFNNRVDANHRYTTDPAIQSQMINRGYIAEGYGPNAVIMCATL
jgi:hypothetical protein